MAAKLCDIPIFEGKNHEGLSKSSVLHDVMCCYITKITSNIAYKSVFQIWGGRGGRAECKNTWLSRMCSVEYEKIV